MKKVPTGPRNSFAGQGGSAESCPREDGLGFEGLAAGDSERAGPGERPRDELLFLGISRPSNPGGTNFLPFSFDKNEPL